MSRAAVGGQGHLGMLASVYPFFLVWEEVSGRQQMQDLRTLGLWGGFANLGPGVGVVESNERIAGAVREDADYEGVVVIGPCGSSSGFAGIPDVGRVGGRSHAWSFSRRRLTVIYLNMQIVHQSRQTPVSAKPPDLVAHLPLKRL